MNKFGDLLSKLRYFGWPLLAVAWIYASGKVAAWLNHGRALLDDPSAVYGYSFLVYPIINAMFITALYSSFLNNTLTREEYVRANWQSKIVDNTPELIVFICCLWFFHAHS